MSEEEQMIKKQIEELVSLLNEPTEWLFISSSLVVLVDH